MHFVSDSESDEVQGYLTCAAVFSGNEADTYTIELKAVPNTAKQHSILQEELYDDYCSDLDEDQKPQRVVIINMITYASNKKDRSDNARQSIRHADGRTVSTGGAGKRGAEEQSEGLQ